MKKEVFNGAKDTMVQIVDWTYINEKISEAVGFKVECRMGKGYIPSVTAVFEKDTDDGIFKYSEGKKTRGLLIDTECCGLSAKESSFLMSDTNEKPFSCNLFEGIGFFKVEKEEKGDIVSHAMFPSYYINIDEDDVKSCLTGKEIPMHEFMGSRYGYNPRIRSNERNILNLIFHEAKEEGNMDWKESKELEWEAAV
jgi:hypothetical protein